MDQLLNFIEFNQYNLPAILQLFVLYALFMWLAVVVWTLRDITTRSSNLLVIIASTLFVATGTVPALIIYLLIRPSQTLEDNRNKDLFYASVLDEKVSICKECHGLVRTSYKFCPHCSHDLEEACPNCAKKINPSWKYCPTCNEKLILEPQFNLKKLYPLHTARKAKSFILSTLKRIFRRTKTTVTKVKNSAQKIEINIQLPKLPRLPQVRRIRPVKLKVMAAEKHSAVKQVKVSTVKASSSTSAAAKKQKRGRGRPKGIADNKPRKKRADAGKKRGHYKK